MKNAVFGAIGIVCSFWSMVKKQVFCLGFLCFSSLLPFIFVSVLLCLIEPSLSLLLVIMPYSLKQGPKKDGEKYNLLITCGQLVFGCSGKKQFTQGIYTARPGDDEFTQCFCKRGVWVPNIVSIRKLRTLFKSFQAIFPTVIVNTVGRGNLGLCGKSPTRTLHANDTEFMLLARPPGQFYRVVALVTLKPCEGGNGENPFVLHDIVSDSSSIAQCIDWVKNEAMTHDRREYKPQTVQAPQPLLEICSPCAESLRDDLSELELESDDSKANPVDMPLITLQQGDSWMECFQPPSKKQEFYSLSPFAFPFFTPDVFFQDIILDFSLYQHNIPTQ